MSFTTLSTRPAYKIHKSGYIAPTVYTTEVFDTALAYIPDNDDVIIATYPKCGTTWMQYILYLMKNKGRPLDVDQNINTFIPHLEECGLKAVIQQAQPRIIKTHLPYHLVPKNSKTRYVYVARNPKDCCVSYFHHTQGFSMYNFGDGIFNEFYEMFLAGKVEAGDYFDHLLSWIEHKNDSNVLFLLYEEMKSDTGACIKKIGSFLGGVFQKAVQNDDMFRDILKYSSFDSMKNNPTMWSSERLSQSAPFIRKGIIGDWRNYFSTKQSYRLDQKFKSKLSGTTGEFLWQNYECLILNKLKD